MSKENLSAELLALAKTSPEDESKPKAARVRAVLPEIEAALNAGATHAQVWEKLQAHGLTMSLAVFNTTLRRVRAAAGGKGAGTELPAVAPVAVKAPAPAAPKPAPQLPDLSEPVDMARLINAGKTKD